MSLTSDDLADIKQLLEVAVANALNNSFEEKTEKTLKDILDEKLEQQSRTLRKALKEDMDVRLTEQDEKLDEILDAVGTDLAKHTASIDDHETRIVRLEKHPA